LKINEIGVLRRVGKKSLPIGRLAGKDNCTLRRLDYMKMVIL
jgi:hypothetical protein